MVLIPAGIMSVSLLRKNEPFFNIHEIVQEYRKLIRGSTIVFFILPLLFSVGLALLYTAGTRFYSEIGVILGIILSMLLASLSILCNYDFSEVRDEQQRKKGRDVVKTTINVVFFDVLMCVFLLLYGLVIIVLSDGDYTWLHIDITLLKVIISAVSYYVFSIIMLNLILFKIYRIPCLEKLFIDHTLYIVGIVAVSTSCCPQSFGGMICHKASA